MENAFIGILNRSLLTLCFVFLVGAAGLAALAIYNYSKSFDPIPPPQLVTVPIVTFSEASRIRAANANATNAESALNSGDPLGASATDLCNSKNHFLSVITNNHLSIANPSGCQNAYEVAARSYGGRAWNYLVELKRHYDAQAADSKAPGLLSSATSDQMDRALGGLEGRFNQNFTRAVNASEAATAARYAEAASHKAIGLWLIGAAGSGFFAFLVVAFLMVFLRIEKHLEKISEARVAPSPIEPSALA